MGYKQHNYPWPWKVGGPRQFAFEPSERAVGIQQPPSVAPAAAPNLPGLAFIHSLPCIPPGLEHNTGFHPYLLNRMVWIELQWRQWPRESKYLAESCTASKNEVEFRIWSHLPDFAVLWESHIPSWIYDNEVSPALYGWVRGSTHSGLGGQGSSFLTHIV